MVSVAPTIDEMLKSSAHGTTTSDSSVGASATEKTAAYLAGDGAT